MKEWRKGSGGEGRGTFAARWACATAARAGCLAAFVTSTLEEDRPVPLA